MRTSSSDTASSSASPRAAWPRSSSRRAPASRASRSRSRSSASSRTSSEKKRFIAMFLDEARLSAHLSHSNVVQVFDIGVGDNTYFIVMEYVDGADLKAVVEFMPRRSADPPVEAACFIAAKICEGLTYAHELKVERRAARCTSSTATCRRPTCSSPSTARSRSSTSASPRRRASSRRARRGSSRASSATSRPRPRRASEVDLRTDIFAVGDHPLGAALRAGASSSARRTSPR
jgi:hypothetical protein